MFIVSYVSFLPPEIVLQLVRFQLQYMALKSEKGQVICHVIVRFYRMIDCLSYVMFHIDKNRLPLDNKNQTTRIYEKLDYF